MGVDELPEQIAQDIQEAINDNASEAQVKMREAELEVERQRIKAEERISERMAERDEHIANTQAGVDELRSMFSQMLSRLDSFMSNSAGQMPVVHTEINTPDDEDDDDDNDENPIASEDSPPEENPEILGGDTENGIEAAVENPVEEIENVEDEIINGKSGRNKRRKRGRR